MQIAVNIGYTPRFVIQVRPSSTNCDRSRLKNESHAATNRLQNIGRQNAFTGSSTRYSHRHLGESAHSVPEHLCSHTKTRKSLNKIPNSARGSETNNSKGAFQRSKSEGRAGRVRSPDVAAYDAKDAAEMTSRLSQRDTVRTGSRRQRNPQQQQPEVPSAETTGNGVGGEFHTPAAKLIESRRRKKRDRSLDDKALERRPGSLRSSRSKSVSNIFQKTFSLRKKENPMIPRTEVSVPSGSYRRTLGG